MRIFSSALYCLRVLRLMSRMICSDDEGRPVGFRFISTPQVRMNKNTLLNQNQICSIGADGVHYRLGDQALPLFDTPIYVEGSVEAGNVWQTTDTIAWDNTLVARTVFIVFDSILGPLYIAYGAAEGCRRSAYLFLGQTF